MRAPGVVLIGLLLAVSLARAQRADPPTVLVGVPVTTDGYDPAVARRVVGAQRALIAECLREHVGSAVRLRVTLDAAGRVASAEPSAPHDPGIALVVQCLVDLAREWRFPAPTGGRAEITVSMRARVQQGYGISDAFAAGPRTTPTATISRIEVVGGSSRQVVRRVLHRHRNELRFCHEQALSASPELAGTVVATFTVGATGSVDASAIASSTLANETVEACVVRAIRRWTFPAPAEGVVSARFTVAFALPPPRRSR